MSYLKWFDEHALKHKRIVDKLVKLDYTNEEIVDYFDYDKMIINEVEFCPLYKQNKRCHDMKELNCYLCACPNFRFDDNGLGSYNNHKVLSKCDINNGEKLVTKTGVIHHDCSSCEVPHHKSFILKNFSLEWREIMKNCHKAKKGN